MKKMERKPQATSRQNRPLKKEQRGLEQTVILLITINF